MTVRTLGASATAIAQSHLTHNLATTGFLTKAASVVQGTMAAFNTTTATKIGLYVTTGTLEVLTVQQCFSEIRK
jgi:hypothetical protein